jgi:hypothetical protein
MALSNTGTYTPIAGAETAAPGQVVQSAVWNAINTDYAGALASAMMQQLGVNTPRNIAWMNGGLEIWQRSGPTNTVTVAAQNTSNTGAYTCDRWYLSTQTAQGSTVTATTGLNNGSQFAATIRRSSGNTGTAQMTFGYPLDTDEVLRMRGKTVAVSFTAKAGANMSNTTLNCAVYVGTGSVAKFVTGFSNSTNVVQLSANLSATATSFNTAGSISVPTNATQGEVFFFWNPSGTAGADDSFTVDDIELDTQGLGGLFIYGYERIPFNMGLDGCRRHYLKTFPYNSSPANSAGFSGAITLFVNTATAVSYHWRFPVQMRTTPSILTFSPNTANSSFSITSGAVIPTSVNSASELSQDSVTIYSTNTIGGNTAVFVHATADSGI